MMKMNKNVCVWMAVVGMLVAASQAAEYSVMKFGAKADGKTDDSEAIMKAWHGACNDTMESKVHVSPGTYMTGSLVFEGPCKAPVAMQCVGVTFLAPPDPSKLNKEANSWIVFQYLNNFRLHGGIWDGQGQEAWKKNNWKTCLGTAKCPPIPMNMHFHAVNNSLFQDITSKDSKNFHMNCITSKNVTFERINITAPAESPNTDGIHIARSSDIKVVDSDIRTGDDCVSMQDDLNNVLIKNTKCGPGHGISIGSLGKQPNEKDVNNITITGCTLRGSDNGVRIKTWPSAPNTIKVTDIKFLDLTMENASNPIIIDQQYCPWNLCSLDKPSLIQISKLKVADVKGTSATKDCVIFSCSSAKPCTDVEVGNIDLKYIGDPKLGEASTRCENVKFTATGKQNPPLCVKGAGAAAPGAGGPGGKPAAGGDKGGKPAGGDKGGDKDKGGKPAGGDKGGKPAGGKEGKKASS